MNKDTLFLKLRYLFPSLALLAVFLLAPVKVWASPEDQKVYDNGNILTDSQEAALEALCRKYGDKVKLDIVITTIDDDSLPHAIHYLEDMYDEKLFGYNQKAGDTIMICIDMARRDVYMEGYGKAEQHLDSERIQKIIKKITPDLSAGEYEKALKRYITLSANYYKIKPGINPDSPFFKTRFQLLIALVIGALSVFIMAFRSGTRMTAGIHTYMDPHNARLLGKHDRYIRTTTTRVQRPRNNDSGSSGGGGSSGGVSSGGHSHSTGGGKF